MNNPRGGGSYNKYGTGRGAPPNSGMQIISHPHGGAPPNNYNMRGSSSQPHMPRGGYQQPNNSYSNYRPESGSHSVGRGQNDYNRPHSSNVPSRGSYNNYNPPSYPDHNESSYQKPMGRGAYQPRGRSYDNPRGGYNPNYNRGGFQQPPAYYPPQPMNQDFVPRPRRNTRWKNPIIKQEISSFFSEYATFILSAKAYHAENSTPATPVRTEPQVVRESHPSNAPAIVPPKVSVTSEGFKPVSETSKPKSEEVKHEDTPSVATASNLQPVTNTVPVQQVEPAQVPQPQAQAENKETQPADTNPAATQNAAPGEAQ